MSYMENQETGATSNLSKLWNSLVAAVGVIVGLIPHVLHHIGLFAGTALIAGATGTVFFGLIGLIASLPMMIMLHRRFGTWRAPFIALVLFLAMFLLSTLVIGPAIRDKFTKVTPASSSPAPQAPVDHESHHQ